MIKPVWLDKDTLNLKMIENTLSFGEEVPDTSQELPDDTKHYGQTIQNQNPKRLVRDSSIE